PVPVGSVGVATVIHGSPMGLAPEIHLPTLPRLTLPGFVAGPPTTAKSDPVPLGPACERSTVPTVTAVALSEFTWIARFGPPNICNTAAPATENAPLAVPCITSTGIGTATGTKPQPALADMLKVERGDT